MLFEAKVGNGKLMVTSLNFTDSLANRPAARQLMHSLKLYLNSAQFNPAESIDLNVIKDLFRSPSWYVFDAYTKDSPDELKPQPPTKKQ